MEATDLSLIELRDALRDGRLSAVEATRAYLARIETHDGALGAYLTVDAEGALAQAAEVDRARAAGEPVGELAGVPIGLKDIFLTRGLRTTCASRILERFVPVYDGTVVERLRAAGAVILGKLNMDEFAMGSSTENSAFQKTRNPWDLDRTPGGSSGGSSAAVAARLCAGSFGTDTGGSIRQPAALCGIVGLKPTWGRVSRFGVIAFASSLDQVGPMGRTVRDVALLEQVVAGFDPRDSTSSAVEVPQGLAELPKGALLQGLRVGLPREYFPATGLDPEVADAVRTAVAQLEALGAEVREVSLPHSPLGVSAYYLVATAEASSNLARYDGVRFGHRAAAPDDLFALYARSRGEGFGLEVKRRIMLGTFALSAGYYEAYYRKAGQVRTLILQDFERAFEQVDVIATPTSPSTAFRLGERLEDPLQMYLADIFTISCNLAGLPGLSIPCGFGAGGLPIGLQLLGRAFDEATLLRVGAAYEDSTTWGARRPPGAFA
ncbi:MAG: Asp-tRNA(Asn)/Glu-tRNA(Gln) amidotransferase subunit GatA [Bradymonadia bacterium]